MSYHPDNQALDPGINMIIDGIKLLNSAIQERINDCGEWRKEHITEIRSLCVRMTDLMLELIELRNETW